MEFTYFPVELAQLGAAIAYEDLTEGRHELGGFPVSTQFLNHPAIALGYRIEARAPRCFTCAITSPIGSSYGIRIPSPASWNRFSTMVTGGMLCLCRAPTW